MELSQEGASVYWLLRDSRGSNFSSTSSDSDTRGNSSLETACAGVCCSQPALKTAGREEIW